MIADYYVVRRCHLDVDALYRRGGPYEYTGGFHVTALVALLVGILPNLPGFLGALAAVALDPDSIWTKIYNWAWFVGFFLAGATYLAGIALTGKRASAGSRAAA